MRIALSLKSGQECSDCKGYLATWTTSWVVIKTVKHTDTIRQWAWGFPLHRETAANKVTTPKTAASYQHPAYCDAQVDAGRHACGLISRNEAAQTLLFCSVQLLDESKEATEHKEQAYSLSKQCCTDGVFPEYVVVSPRRGFGYCYSWTLGMTTRMGTCQVWDLGSCSPAQKAAVLCSSQEA